MALVVRVAVVEAEPVPVGSGQELAVMVVEAEGLVF